MVVHVKERNSCRFRDPNTPTEIYMPWQLWLASISHSDRKNWQNTNRREPEHARNLTTEATQCE